MVGKSRLTEEDINNYHGMKTAKDIGEELESWGQSVPLELYITKGYKRYKQPYLGVISNVVIANIKINRDTQMVLTEEPGVYFKMRDGECYKGKQDISGTAHETTDITTLGREHFLEFLSYYLGDIVQEKLESTIEQYYINYNSYETVLLGSLIRDVLEQPILDFIGLGRVDIKDVILNELETILQGLTLDNAKLEKQAKEEIYINTMGYLVRLQEED